MLAASGRWSARLLSFVSPARAIQPQYYYPRQQFQSPSQVKAWAERAISVEGVEPGKCFTLTCLLLLKWRRPFSRYGPLVQHTVARGIERRRECLRWRQRIDAPLALVHIVQMKRPIAPRHGRDWGRPSAVPESMHLQPLNHVGFPEHIVYHVVVKPKSYHHGGTGRRLGR